MRDKRQRSTHIYANRMMKKKKKACTENVTGRSSSGVESAEQCSEEIEYKYKQEVTETEQVHSDAAVEIAMM